ncbi:hypothetical protein COV18_03525 [Candidatus Woesearchaeota archaeon CG10_big_fil_rev_8_21_14_0_10_37_12]|nr:MAG: hypothetical protein COV18_03525 [Candidatus Woesearchaeota archaeon CG10_big_fil_rev_8_21_14_0_10_37_12]
MELKTIAQSLHEYEKKVLPRIRQNPLLNHLAEASGLQEVEVSRALQWLSNKKLITVNTEEKEIIELDENGKKYQQQGLPERRLLTELTNKPTPANELAKKANLNQEEMHACIGLLRRQNAFHITKNEDLLLSITPQGTKLLAEGFPGENILRKSFPLKTVFLTDQEKQEITELTKRKKIINIEKKKIISAQLTTAGEKLLAEENLDTDFIERLTPEMIKTGNWKGKNFRRYDVEVQVPAINGGRKHFENEAVEYIKRIWLDMGFKEMTGNFVHSAFWDLDALFVPQDHPAREMQDTFYIPGKAKLPAIWTKIKEAHENGAGTGSRGWQYKYSKQEAEKILLRTHTTVLSARTIANLKKEDLPAKFFAVGKVFRNEALDWKHLFEFYQVDGIVVDPNANLKHLKGYLRQFYKKMGFPGVRMRPAHFPYTEPSLEVDVFHPVKKEWVEFGGAGIFRPEVVKPLLGFDCPVLAWGQGMGRYVSEYWKLTDIRQLNNNDLKQLREIKTWLK